ncbi:hypothetical protein [Granulicella aggregans]|uniref:hypothetical protein n=1 Tax=Granulicella aggregans TaxID=474949 RepID=UPI0021E09BBA|nr:hypothetical protein [Granulicella aggregans]
MKTPWTDKTGLAKLVAILATILLISLGLCGANFFAVLSFMGSPEAPRGVTPWPMKLLEATGRAELIAIFGSTFALLLVLVISSGRAVIQRLNLSEKQKSQGVSSDEDAMG